jgi:hypothetical protein
VIAEDEEYERLAEISHESEPLENGKVDEYEEVDGEDRGENEVDIGRDHPHTYPAVQT